MATSCTRVMLAHDWPRRAPAGAHSARRPDPRATVGVMRLLWEARARRGGCPRSRPNRIVVAAGLVDRVREAPSRGVRLVLAQEYRAHLLRVNGPVDSVRAQHVPGHHRLRVRELQPVDVERPGRAAEGLGDDILAESRVVVVDTDLADVADDVAVVGTVTLEPVNEEPRASV